MQNFVKQKHEFLLLPTHCKKIKHLPLLTKPPLVSVSAHVTDQCNRQVVKLLVQRLLLESFKSCGEHFILCVKIFCVHI